jgi:hypothetical protein
LTFSVLGLIFTVAKACRFPHNAGGSASDRGSAVLDRLLDGFWTISLVLGSAGVALGIVWLCNGTGMDGYAICVTVVAILLGVNFALQLLIEKESEQMERRIRDMGASVRERQIRRALEMNLSENFYANSYDKRKFIEIADELRDHYHVDSLEVWDIRTVEINRSKATAKIGFKMRPKLVEVRETAFYLVEADFVRTSLGTWHRRGEWKMRSFRYFNPAVDSNSPQPIP